MPKGYAISDTKNWTDFKVIDFDLKVCIGVFTDPSGACRR